jgi:hypothetical protein
VHRFPKNLEALQNPRRQKDGTTNVSYSRPTNFKPPDQKYQLHGEIAPEKLTVPQKV